MGLQERRELEKRGILVLKKGNEDREIEFELRYLASLTLEERFSAMLAKSRELNVNLAKNGHRRAAAITKRT